MSQIAARLAELGIKLPAAPKPAANYVPYVISGGHVYVSGQISQNEDGLIKGVLGENMDVAAGQDAARACGLALLAQLQAACEGNLDRVEQVVRLGGFVNCRADFTDQPAVINGASDLMAEIFADKGAHARAAVGVNSLPLGVAVEVDGIFRIS